MTKEELIVLLKKYRENKAKHIINIKSIRRLKNIITNMECETKITAGFDVNASIQSKNKISDKVMNAVVKADNKSIRIVKEIEELEDINIKIQEEIEIVEDRIQILKYAEKKMLEAYFFDGRTSEDIGNTLYLELFNQTRSVRHIQREIKKAIEKMSKI